MQPNSRAVLCWAAGGTAGWTANLATKQAAGVAAKPGCHKNASGAAGLAARLATRELVR